MGRGRYLLGTTAAATVVAASLFTPGCNGLLGVQLLTYSAEDGGGDGSSVLPGGDAAVDATVTEAGGDDAAAPPDASLPSNDGGDANADASDGASPDAPSCTPSCALGQSRCAAGGVETCKASSAGCPGWSPTATCGPHQSCDAAPDAGASCLCEATLCTAAGTVCQDAQTEATCATDADGCLYVASTLTCTGPQSCSGAAPSAGCSLTCADSCQLGGTACVSGGLATCAKGANGCLSYGAPTACVNGACSGTAGTASCCTNACAAGATQCVAGAVETCTTKATGCTAWGAPAACTAPSGGSVACTGGSCVPSCGSLTYCPAQNACADLTSSGTNCGACGKTCTPGVACTTSQCLVEYGYSSSTGDGQLTLIPGTLHAIQITVSVPITVLKLGVVMEAGPGNAIMMLYKADASGTLVLVAATASAPVSSGSNLYPVTSPVSIAAGTYWVAAEFSGQAIAYTDGNTNIPSITKDFLTYGLSSLPTMTTSDASSSSLWPLFVIGAE